MISKPQISPGDSLGLTGSLDVSLRVTSRFLTPKEGTRGSEKDLLLSAGLQYGRLKQWPGAPKKPSLGHRCSEARENSRKSCLGPSWEPPLLSGLPTEAVKRNNKACLGALTGASPQAIEVWKDAFSFAGFSDRAGSGLGSSSSRVDHSRRSGRFSSVF